MSGPAFADLRRQDRSVSTVSASGSTESLLLGVNDVTFDENCTVTFPAVSGVAPWAFTLIARQDGGGGATITWPASVDWDAGTAPTQTTTASNVAIYEFLTVDEGTTWFGFLAADQIG